MRLGTLWTTAALVAVLAVPTAAQTYTTVMTGAQEVPPNASAATGNAILTLDGTQTAGVLSVSFANLGSAYANSHIHVAPAGSNGPVRWGFTGAPAGWVFSNGNRDGVLTNFAIAGITAGDLATLNNGGMYINIHSQLIPGGEIRGQLTLASVPAVANSWGRVKSLYR